MNYHKSNLFILLLLLTFWPVTLAPAQDWKPISKEEINQTKPKVDPEADAEAFFWEVKIDDSGEDMIRQNYVRVKIFTEKGRERFSKIDIQYAKGLKISDIAARVIKTDGSISELKKDDVFDREIIKTNNIKLKAKSFAVPNIEVGSIIEYRYKETFKSGSANYMKFIFQRDVPIQSSVYLFKPFRDGRFISFNLQDTKPEKDKGGYYRMSIQNVPALKEEPYMPPEDEIRAWGIFYYTSIQKDDFLDFWARIGSDLVQSYDIRDTLSPGKDSKKVVEELIGANDSETEKLRKIYNFTKTKIRNLTYDTTITDEEREKIKPNGSPEQTLKKEQGFADEINDLFATLAIAAGFEARIAFTGDRSEIFFSRKYQVSSFIERAAIAVKTSAGWQYFDPGTPFLPFGLVAWVNDNQDALLLGKKNYLISQIPMSQHSQNNIKRTGNFVLTEDGTLEGKVKIEMTGNIAYQYRLNTYEDSPNKREERLKERVNSVISAAQLSDISIENLNNAELPVVQSYRIKIPGYAQKTGKRIFFQPGFFEYNVKPRFSSANRSYDVYFPYPWSENDSIEIKLPEGFELDNATSPGEIADPAQISSLNIRISFDSTSKSLIYKRDFFFGNKGNIFFPASSYSLVKNFFDALNVANSHTLALKQKN